MVEDKWLLLASIPVVVFLGISIWRRLRELNGRIDQLNRDEAAGPVNPYQAMYEVMSEDSTTSGARQPSALLLKAMGKSSPANGHSPDPRNTPDTGRRQTEDNDG